MKRVIATMVFIAMIILPISQGAQAVTTTAGQPGYTDTAGHWAEEAILRWSELGVLKGSAGRFMPDDSISRAELAAIINRVIGFPASSEDFFSDTAGKWYEADVNAVALQGIYITSTGQALGEKALTREEAVEMMYRAFMTDDSFSISGTPAAFNDMSDVSPDYNEAVKVFRSMQFINGYPDGSFHPQEPFTRAQVVTILNNIIEIYITDPGTYNIPENANVCVAAPGVTLNGRYINYLILLPKTAEGVTSLEYSPRYGMVWGEHAYRDAEKLKVASPWATGLHFKQVRLSVDKEFAGGSGRPDDPFLIKTEAQLKKLNNYLSQDYKDYCFKLANDINLSSPWTPIGSGAGAYGADISLNDMFWGTLDGGGYSIKNMNITHKGDNICYFGLFSYLHGTVINLSLSGSFSVESTAAANSGFASEIVAGGIAGGVMGHSDGRASIDNCTVDITIDIKGSGNSQAGGIAGSSRSARIQNCSASGTIKVSSSSNVERATAGGIVGTVTGASTAPIFDNRSDMDITASGGESCYAGGICGNTDRGLIMQRCVASGTIYAKDSIMQNNAGGVVGQMAGQGYTVEQCASFADVRASGNPGYFNAAGGLVGAAYTNCSITNSYSAGTVTVEGPASVGGLVGRVECKITTCYTVAKITAPESLSSSDANGITGTVRGSFFLKACGVFNVAEPHFISTDEANDIFIFNPVGNRSLSSAETYKELGNLTHTSGNANWNFTTVWTFGDAGYAYPILQKIPQELQTAK